MKDLWLIKIGGNVIDDESALTAFLQAFTKIPTSKILVHGGGKIATTLANQLGIDQQMIDGRRITDAETLKVVTMVYGGWINKNLVSQLNALGQTAIGLTGADARILPARKRPVSQIDYGFAGDLLPEAIQTGLLTHCLENGLTPVIAPISADETGQLLNINADTIAQGLAIALSPFFKVHLLYCFDLDGVLEDIHQSESLIASMDEREYEQLKGTGVIQGGMIPKLDNAFSAIRQGVHRVLLGRAEKLQDLINGSAGTTILSTVPAP
jgi:acetylglutamate kinase